MRRLNHHKWIREYVVFGTDRKFRILDDLLAGMNTNRQRLEISQRIILIPRIEGQDAIVAVDTIMVKEGGRKLALVTPLQVPVKVTTSLDEGIGAICLGEH